ncbi:hypothetical protein OG474_29555 [Kribbella sp. NBC_01505]|uniref:hypothetical protein n=1 Tax=Kribbella sp. NBC_01505 TaxID=2903580 RepID=UPI0038689D19
MKDLDTQLPELMVRATDGLEPESVDLVERSVVQGVRLRQRRSALAGVAGGVAVLATVGVVVGAVQHFDQGGSAEPAGSLVVGPAVTPTPAPSAPVPGASEEVYTPPVVNTKDPTLQTLKSLVSGSGRTLSAPENWGGKEDGFFAAGWVVDDGKGGSRVQVLLERHEASPSCAGVPGCHKRPDGSTIRSESLGPEYSDGRQKEFGIVSSYVEITRKDGRKISLTAYNGVSEKGTKHTRAVPILTVAQMTKLADNQAWKFPAKVTK